jgi:hypothetical protein
MSLKCIGVYDVISYITPTMSSLMRYAMSRSTRLLMLSTLGNLSFEAVIYSLIPWIFTGGENGERTGTRRVFATRNWSVFSVLPFYLIRQQTDWKQRMIQILRVPSHVLNWIVPMLETSNDWFYAAAWTRARFCSLTNQRMSLQLM